MTQYSRVYVAGECVLVNMNTKKGLTEHNAFVYCAIVYSMKDVTTTIYYVFVKNA